MGKLVRGGEWIREVEVGLVGAVGRLDWLLPEAWLPLSSFLRGHPCRRLFWHWERPALGTSWVPALPQRMVPEGPFSS